MHVRIHVCICVYLCVGVRVCICVCLRVCVIVAQYIISVKPEVRQAYMFNILKLT